jgi:hypothetical protein
VHSSAVSALLRIVRGRLQRNRALRALHRRLPPGIRSRLVKAFNFIVGRPGSGTYPLTPRAIALKGEVDSVPDIHRSSLVPSTPEGKIAQLSAGISRHDSLHPKISVNLESHPWPLPDRMIPFGVDTYLRPDLAAFSLQDSKDNTALLRVTGWEVSKLVAPSPERIARDVDDYRNRLQRHLGVIDDLGEYKNARTRAYLLATAAAVGTPVILSDEAAEDPVLRIHLGTKVIDAMRNLSVSNLIDPADRLRIAFTQWAAVHDQLGMAAHWHRVLAGTPHANLLAQQPSVSVLVATNRPEMIANWVPQLAVHDWKNLEVIAVLHGDGFSTSDEHRITSALGDKVRLLRRSSEVPLGGLLAAASEVAEGEFVVKWDDDDLYSRTHIADLVRTHRYSGATLVGKACEYVYLSGLNVTVQRIQGPREALSSTIAGGTMCIAREDLTEIGGWVEAPRRVDSLLIDKVLAAGGHTYRAVGFGYMMMRASDPNRHTWAVGDETFVVARNPQRRGLASDWAMVNPPEEVLNLWRR